MCQSRRPSCPTVLRYSVRRAGKRPLSSYPSTRDKGTKLLSLHVWTIGPDGHEYALKDTEIVQYGYPERGVLYDDQQYMVAKAPGADPGGVVAYEYEQRARPYINETTWFFRASCRD